MLYLDSPVELHGLTIYRDYNDKRHFYYLPKSPRLSIENREPMFQLLVYREITDSNTEVHGGGFLTMTTDLGVEEATLQRVRDELSSLFGTQALLAPVPVKSGSVRVTALDSNNSEEAAPGQLRFVENIVANGKPSLYGDQRAAFTAELSKEGAVLMKAALKAEGATPVVLVYDLQFSGLHPAYEVTIKIKFSQSYQHLRSRFQMNTLWFRTDIDDEMESLIKSGNIEIESVNYETEEPAAREARMTQLNALAKELAQWSFFKPALNPGAVLATDRGTLTAYDARPDVTSITTGLTRSSRAALTGVGAREDVGTPRRSGTAVATDALEDTPRPGTTPAGSSSPPATNDNEPMTAVEAWNRAGRPQGAYMLRSLQQDERQEIEYKMRQVSAVDRSIAPQGQIRLLEGSTDLPGRILDIDLDSDFFKTIKGRIFTSADLDAVGVTSINVKVRYGVKDDGSRWKDNFEALLTAAGDTWPYSFFIDDQANSGIEYQVILNYRDDFMIGHNDTTEMTEWIATTTRNLDINPLSYSTIIHVSLETAMVDWNQVKQVQVRVLYEDSDANINAADTKVLTSESTSAVVPIRPLNPDKRTVTVEANFFYNDNESETLILRQDGDEPFIINQPPDSTTLVDVRLQDQLERYKQINVQLSHQQTEIPDVEHTILVDHTSTTGQWSFRREDPTDNKFSFQRTDFLTDGSIRETSWSVSDNPLIVVGDKIAGILTVTVLFLGSLADGNFRLAKLKLNYPDAPDWADPNIEYLFRTGTEEFTWQVPMQDIKLTDYTYTITWFNADGSRTVTGPVSTNAETLIIDPLAP